MVEAVYDGSLEGLFGILDGVCRGTALPDQVMPASGGQDIPAGSGRPGFDASNNRDAPVQGNLFGADIAGKPYAGKEERAGRNNGVAAKELFSVSVNAYDQFVHGWMSELPIAAALIRFAWKVISAGRRGGYGRPGGTSSPEARLAAGRAAVDRGDPAVAATLAAAFKVCREIDRLQGLLRFAPDKLGVYTARCAPDHFVLPGLAEHFFRRFGGTPWTIIDEKRALALVCPAEGEPRLVQTPALPQAALRPAEPARSEAADTPDPWTELWRNYHRVINNESRRNPALQRQFMPVRYRKYLNEL
jgi:hypothetical protein